MKFPNEKVYTIFQTVLDQTQSLIRGVPTPLSILINDICDHIGGGLRIKYILLKDLMMADDIVILPSEIDTLQFMINNLDKCARKWNLNINLSKSKIYI